MLVTYLLEGRPGTFLKPDASSRFVYTVIANVLIGTLGAALVIRAVLNLAALPQFTPYGITRPRRTLVVIIVAAVLATLFLAGQQLPSWDPVILANASAQVLVVSIAEVVVCWALLAAVLRNALGPGWISASIAVIVAGLAFGAYHLAHSAPFNTMPMVVLLSAVGLVTGTFFFLSGDLYGTIVLHNSFAVRGVVKALADSRNLEPYAKPQLPLIVTAVAAVVVLIVADVKLIRPYARSKS